MSVAMANGALRRKIFVGCRQLGLDDDTRRDLQVVATGKDSLSEMNEDDLNAVLQALVVRGFKPQKGQPSKRAKATRADVRYVHVLWRLLGDAGHLARPDRAGLNAFIRSRFGKTWGAVPLDIDDLNDWEKIDAVIQALTNMCERNGVEIDRDRQRR